MVAGRSMAGCGVKKFHSEGVLVLVGAWLELDGWTDGPRGAAACALRTGAC